MSATTTDSSSCLREVWVQREGRSEMRLFIEPHTKIIEDLKVLVYGDSRDEYRTFYLQQFIAAGTAIPTDVSCENPIVFKSIINRPCKYFFCCTSK
jgi:hypothetical protein